MVEFWESRYSDPAYAYGVQPNEFLRQELKKIPEGKILFPAEGEGRNAVYAARKGFDVHAFDFSTEARRKALALAEEQGVSIDYRTATYENIEYSPDSFDVIVLVFAHMPPDKRTHWHRKLSGFLKQGGLIILQGFSKEQMNYPSGGPRNVDMLFSKEELFGDFSGLEVLFMEQHVIPLDEGLYHKGDASVISALFRK